MDDKNFDESIKKALLNYQNETPVFAGWGRLGLSSAYGWTLKNWLIGSLLVNAVLITVLGYLFINQWSLNDRLHDLESRSYFGENALIGPELENRIDIRVEDKSEAENIVSTKLALPDKKSLAQNSLSPIPQRPKVSSYLSMPFRMKSIGFLPPDYTFRLIGDINENSPFQYKNSPVTKKLAKVDRGTLIELEKNRFGKKVLLEPAITMLSDYNNAMNGYTGVGVGIGGEMQMKFHPFWSLNSGIGYTHLNLKSSSENIQNEWRDFFQFNYVGELVKIHRGIHLIKIPLLLERHIPVNQKTSLSIGAGLNTNFLISQKVDFESRVLEHEDDEPNEEEEYHYFIETYHDKGLKKFNTGARYDMVLSHRLKQIPIYWKAGLYFEHAFSGLEVANEMKTYGFTAMLSWKK